MAATGIVTAVEQQGAATEEISRNITEASQSVAEVASSARTVSQAAEASSAISGDVLEASRQLTLQASDLSANMQRFLKSVQAA
jgi:methyl-accepting chemotaxis protein